MARSHFSYFHKYTVNLSRRQITGLLFGRHRGTCVATAFPPKKSTGIEAGPPFDKWNDLAVGRRFSKRTPGNIPPSHKVSNQSDDGLPEQPMVDHCARFAPGSVMVVPNADQPPILDVQNIIFLIKFPAGEWHWKEIHQFGLP